MSVPIHMNTCTWYHDMPCVYHYFSLFRSYNIRHSQAGYTEEGDITICTVWYHHDFFFVCDWHWHSVAVWQCFWPGPCLIFHALTLPWLEVWVVVCTAVSNGLVWECCKWGHEFQCPISVPLSDSGAHKITTCNSCSGNNVWITFN